MAVAGFGAAAKETLACFLRVLTWVVVVVVVFEAARLAPMMMYAALGLAQGHGQRSASKVAVEAVPQSCSRGPSTSRAWRQTQ